jgi:hypothetical protein
MSDHLDYTSEDELASIARRIIDSNLCRVAQRLAAGRLGVSLVVYTSEIPNPVTGASRWYQATSSLTRVQLANDGQNWGPVGCVDPLGTSSGLDRRFCPQPTGPPLTERPRGPIESPPSCAATLSLS